MQVAKIFRKESAFGKYMAYLCEIDSTNNYIKSRNSFLPHGFCAVAQSQLSGRGRQGKSFYSPKGKGLYASVLLKEESVVNDGLLTAKISLAVCRAIDRLTGTNNTNGVKIKWVNDIYFGSKKLCGILCERAKGKDGKDFVVVGIGINLEFDATCAPRDILNTATSLFDVTKNRYDMETLLKILLEEISDILYFDAKKTIELYRKRSCIIGHEINVIRNNKNIRAAALDILPKGELLVRYEDGTCEKLSSGEISIRLSK